MKQSLRFWSDKELTERMEEILEEVGDTSIMESWDRPAIMEEYDKLYEEAYERGLVE